MTTVQITLPDILAQNAQAAGLFSPARMEDILREVRANTQEARP